MSTPLDPSKPLWQFHYVENFEGGSAVIGRIHHCIADGIALIRVLLGMTDDSPVGSPQTRRHRRSRKPPGGGFWLPEVVGGAMRNVRHATGPVLDRTLETLSDPAKALSYVQDGAKGAAVAARLATMPRDPDTMLRGPLGTQKLCTWSEVLPLDEVKSFGKSVGATVNDVLLTGVSGAIGRYIVGRNGSVDGIDIRAVVPVNLRRDEDVGKLGNRFGLVFLSLPIGISDSDERLQVLKQRMDELKESTEAVVAYAILNALGMASPEIEGAAVRVFGAKATAVMTNVPGPRDPIYLAGAPMTSMMFWVPQSARLGLGVSILSYAGEVRLGVATDAGLIPDPEAIIAAFQDEMNEMLARTENT
jgi:WS/DGAT/MGAT family acyltransferase